MVKTAQSEILIHTNSTPRTNFSRSDKVSCCRPTRANLRYMGTSGGGVGECPGSQKSETYVKSLVLDSKLPGSQPPTPTVDFRLWLSSRLTYSEKVWLTVEWGDPFSGTVRAHGALPGLRTPHRQGAGVLPGTHTVDFEGFVASKFRGL